MIRVSEAQAKLFEQNIRGAKPERGNRKPRVKRRKEDLPENIVVSQISGFLQAKGWTVTRQQSGLFKRRWGKDKAPEGAVEPEGMVRIGEKGVSDWRAEKRVSGLLHWVFYWEAKAPGKKPKPNQVLWLQRRNATGTPAAWFDGFEVGCEPFLAWYRDTYEPSLPMTHAERAASDDWAEKDD